MLRQLGRCFSQIHPLAGSRSRAGEGGDPRELQGRGRLTSRYCRRGVTAAAQSKPADVSPPPHAIRTAKTAGRWWEIRAVGVSWSNEARVGDRVSQLSSGGAVMDRQWGGTEPPLPGIGLMGAAWHLTDGRFCTEPRGGSIFQKLRCFGSVGSRHGAGLRDVLRKDEQGYGTQG